MLFQLKVMQPTPIATSGQAEQGDNNNNITIAVLVKQTR
jgi:hypothetical protein